MIGSSVSIILPCYNEADHLERSIKVLVNHSADFKFNYEFIFVEDKSTDNTRQILKGFESTLKNSKFIYHDVNKGRGAAVKSGFEVATGDYVGFIDVDLEVSPSYINAFVESLKTHDVVIANRKYYSKTYLRALIRNIFSNSYRALNKKLLKHSYSDTEAGYKFFNKKALDNFFKQPSNDHWFWDTEFIMYCFNNKLKVDEIEVAFLRDETKQSTVKVLRDSLHYLNELIKYTKKNKK
ncbi:MAG: glycosyltransferase family 2 protein [Bacteroidia bacterium]|nr:glycosyltransferase family 2 protein [Bacteroidia bacterium]